MNEVGITEEGKEMKTSEMEKERERSLLCKKETTAQFPPRCQGFHQPTYEGY
jgi:hypothetical protein